MFIHRWFYRTNHKDIGTLYFIFSIWRGLFGISLSSIIRIELTSPGSFLSNDQLYNRIVTRHAFIIIFCAMLVLSVKLNFYIKYQSLKSKSNIRIIHFSYFLLERFLKQKHALKKFDITYKIILLIKFQILKSKIIDLQFSTYLLTTSKNKNDKFDVNMHHTKVLSMFNMNRTTLLSKRKYDKGEFLLFNFTNSNFRSRTHWNKIEKTLDLIQNLETISNSKKIYHLYDYFLSEDLIDIAYLNLIQKLVESNKIPITRTETIKINLNELLLEFKYNPTLEKKDSFSIIVIEEIIVILFKNIYKKELKFQEYHDYWVDKMVTKKIKWLNKTNKPLNQEIYFENKKDIECLICLIKIRIKDKNFINLCKAILSIENKTIIINQFSIDEILFFILVKKIETVIDLNKEILKQKIQTIKINNKLFKNKLKINSYLLLLNNKWILNFNTDFTFKKYSKKVILNIDLLKTIKIKHQNFFNNNIFSKVQLELNNRKNKPDVFLISPIEEIKDKLIKEGLIEKRKDKIYPKLEWCFLESPEILKNYNELTIKLHDYFQYRDNIYQITELITKIVFKSYILTLKQKFKLTRKTRTLNKYK